MITPEQIKRIKDCEAFVKTCLWEKARARDRLDNPEWIALALFNMIEWHSSIEDRKILARRLINTMDLPSETKGYLRKYFEVY